MTGDGAHQLARASVAEAQLHDHGARDPGWLIRFVFALEDDYLAHGRDMAAEYRAALVRHQAQLQGAEKGGYRDYLAQQVQGDRWTLAALAGRRAALAYQTGRCG